MCLLPVLFKEKSPCLSQEKMHKYKTLKLTTKEPSRSLVYTEYMIIGTQRSSITKKKLILTFVYSDCWNWGFNKKRLGTIPAGGSKPEETVGKARSACREGKDVQKTMTIIDFTSRKWKHMQEIYLALLSKSHSWNPERGDQLPEMP